MKKCLLFIFLLSSFFSVSQTNSGDLETYLNNVISSVPGDGTNKFVNPTNIQLNSWNTIITDILSGNISSARTTADTFNYQIVEYTNTAFTTQKVFYVLEEKSPQSNYWGTYAFAKNPTRELILQAPHIKYDTNTGKQAIYSFVRLANRALLLSGTHRCNSSSQSSCSGTTSACTSSSQPFKISDMAHNAVTAFQKTTEALYNTVSNSFFIQLHGFSKRSSDPYVIMSNGTTNTPSGRDYALDLRNGLASIDGSLTFKLGHIDNWTRLLGTTNTQGRFINSSSNACTTSATTSSGRFVHVEQEKSKLRENSTGWAKMYQALKNTFSETTNIDDFSKHVFFKTENPFSSNISFTGKNISKFAIYNALGKLIIEQKIVNNKVNLDTKNYISGVYFLKVQTNKGSFSKKLLRE